MKLSIDSLRKRDGFVLWTPTFLQDWRCGPSFSRRLDDQPFGGGTDTYENTRQDELGLDDGLHPTGCKGVEMAHEFEQTQRTRFLQPELSTHLWTEGRREEHEAHATIQITDGRVFFFCCAQRLNGVHLPGLTHQPPPGHRPPKTLPRVSVVQMPPGPLAIQRVDPRNV